MQQKYSRTWKLCRTRKLVRRKNIVTGIEHGGITSPKLHNLVKEDVLKLKLGDKVLNTSGEKLSKTMLTEIHIDFKN